MKQEYPGMKTNFFYKKRELTLFSVALMFGILFWDASAPAAKTNDKVKLAVPAGAYKVDALHASLQWSLPYMGVTNYIARFENFDADFILDPDDLSRSTIVVTIDPTSVRAVFPDELYQENFPHTGYKSWSEDIAKNPQYLNAEVFPAISFSSTAVRLTGPSSAIVTGNLSLLGQNKPVTLTVSFNGDIEKNPFMLRPALGFSAEGIFKRSDFSLATSLPSDLIGDDVTIRFDGEFLHRETQPDGSPQALE
jgi:polyisoprenoid-binding protein YceI